MPRATVLNSDSQVLPVETLYHTISQEEAIVIALEVKLLIFHVVVWVVLQLWRGRPSFNALIDGGTQQRG